jgi:hypothetical protein
MFKALLESGGSAQFFYGTPESRKRDVSKLDPQFAPNPPAALY